MLIGNIYAQFQILTAIVIRFKLEPKFVYPNKIDYTPVNGTIFGRNGRAKILYLVRSDLFAFRININYLTL